MGELRGYGEREQTRTDHLRESSCTPGDARWTPASGLTTERWDDLLRVAASVQGGHATAALVVGKLCSSKRQQNAHGTHSVDADGELAQLDADGYRPLRLPSEAITADR